MQQIVNKFIPFILVLIALAAFTFGIVLFAYLLFFGLIIGLILFVSAWIRNHFFPKKNSSPRNKPSGRIIDSDDWTELK
jgi:hypothetical protein